MLRTLFIIAGVAIMGACIAPFIWGEEVSLVFALVSLGASFVYIARTSDIERPKQRELK